MKSVMDSSDSALRKHVTNIHLQYSRIRLKTNVIVDSSLAALGDTECGDLIMTYGIRAAIL